MFIEIIFFVLIMIVYFFIYVDMKVNKNNEIYHYDKELTRNLLYKETFLKLPFYFNGHHINETYDKSILQLRDKNDQYTKYEKIYDSIRLLEPYTRFHASQNIYSLKKKQHLPFLSHHCSINFYIIKKGKVKVSFIHPKFKDNIYKKEKLETNPELLKYVKEHKHIQSLECYENTVIFIPNTWILFIENIHEKSSSIESIHYETLTNQLLGYIKKNLIKGHI